MGYKAEENIDQLDYDFGPFCPDIKGTTPEPDADRIKQYLVSFQAMMRRQRDAIIDWQAKADEIKGDDAKARAKRAELDEEYAKWQDEEADKRLDQRRKMLAMLCSDKPSVEELAQLPGRLFNDFESYMQNEIGPKESRNATS